MHVCWETWKLSHSLLLSDAEIVGNFLSKDIIIWMWTWAYTVCLLICQWTQLASLILNYFHIIVWLCNHICVPLICNSVQIVQREWLLAKLQKWKLRSTISHLLVCWDAETDQKTGWPSSPENNHNSTKRTGR